MSEVKYILNDREAIAQRKAVLVSQLKEAESNREWAINKPAPSLSISEIARWEDEITRVKDRIAKLDKHDALLLSKLPSEEEQVGAKKERDCLLRALKKQERPLSEAWSALANAAQLLEDAARAYDDQRQAVRESVVRIAQLEENFLLDVSKVQESTPVRDDARRVSLQASLAKSVADGYLDGTVDSDLQGLRAKAK